MLLDASTNYRRYPLRLRVCLCLYRPRTTIGRAVSRCFFAMRQLRSVRRSVLSDVFQSLVASLGLTRLDCGNATLAGISAGLTTCLQLVLNAASRIIVGLRRRYSFSQTLADLRAAERIDFKLALTVYRCLHNTAPRYLLRDNCRTSYFTCRSRLRSSSSVFVACHPANVHCRR